MHIRISALRNLTCGVRVVKEMFFRLNKNILANRLDVQPNFGINILIKSNFADYSVVWPPTATYLNLKTYWMIASQKRDESKRVSQSYSFRTIKFI